MAEFDCFPCVSRSGIQVWTMNDVQRVALAGYEVDVEENSRNCANGAAGGDFVYCMQSSVWNQHNIQNELVPLFVFEEMKDSSVVQYYGQKILVLVKVSHRPRIRIRHNCLSNQSLSYRQKKWLVIAWGKGEGEVIPSLSCLLLFGLQIILCKSKVEVWTLDSGSAAVRS